MKLISGGQTGADRGAIQAACDLGLDYGGWVPKGRRSEDGKVPARFTRLREHSSAEYQHRTWANVHEADATVIIARQPLQGGSKLTYRLVHESGRPLLVLSAKHLLTEPDPVYQSLMAWLAECAPGVLNVAGSRESSVPGLQRAVYDLFWRVLDPQGGEWLVCVNEGCESAWLGHAPEFTCPQCGRGPFCNEGCGSIRNHPPCAGRFYP